MSLSNKQQAFVNAYLTCWNATQSAIEAGYSEKTAYSIGARLLKDVEISEAIQTRKAELTMTADEALIRLSEHARGDMGAFIQEDFDDLKKHPQTRLIKKLKKTTRMVGHGDEAEPVVTVELELYDAQAALVHILKEQHLKSGEPTEITDDASLTDEARADRALALLDRARARRDGQPPQAATDLAAAEG